MHPKQGERIKIKMLQIYSTYTKLEAHLSERKELFITTARNTNDDFTHSKQHAGSGARSAKEMQDIKLNLYHT